MTRNPNTAIEANMATPNNVQIRHERTGQAAFSILPSVKRWRAANSSSCSMR